MKNNESVAVTKKKPFKFPDTYVVLFCLMIFMTVLTWLVPAGMYETVVDPVTGASRIDPNSFHYIESTPTTLLGFLKAFYQGCIDKGGIIFMILLLGGFTNIFCETGAISRGINKIADKYDKKALYAIPVLMVVFSILGASAVVVDAAIAFIPLGLVIAKKLKLDPLCGATMIYLGAYSGWVASPMAATSVQVAQELSGLPILSGLGYRLIFSVLIIALSIAFVMRYCLKVREDRSNSVLPAASLKRFDEEIVLPEEGPFTGRDVVVLVVFFAGMLAYVIGCCFNSWGMDMMVAFVMAASLLSGIIAGMKPDDLAKSFGAGVKTMSVGAILCGAAGGIGVIMNSANIAHTVIHGASQLMSLFPGAIAALIMYVLNMIFNFFIPSAPAMAAVVMPIMAPLADVLEIPRQVAVLCYLYGSNFTDCINPGGAIIMGTLGMAMCPYHTWLKWFGKLLAVWSLIGGIAIVLGIFIGLA